jgi:hypothetical protein
MSTLRPLSGHLIFAMANLPLMELDGKGGNHNAYGTRDALSKAMLKPQNASP